MGQTDLFCRRLYTMGRYEMRGLLLIGLLIVLCAVGYLSMRDVKEQLQPVAGSPDHTAAKVKQQIDAITAQHMQRLKAYDQQMSK